jgi:hypothetical protein
VKDDRMKKTLIIIVMFGIVIFGLILNHQFNRINYKKNVFTDKENINYIAKVENQYFYLFQDSKWDKTFLKGVNIGTS